MYKQNLDSISTEHAVTLPNARRFVTLCLYELQEKKEKGLDMVMQWPYQEKGIVNPETMLLLLFFISDLWTHFHEEQKLSPKKN